MNENSVINGALASLANQPVQAPRPTANQVEARAAAESFEALFLSQMLTQMSAGLKTDGPFGGGFGETIYRSMLNEQYGATLASRGGIGIADAVYREMLKYQEVGE